MKINAISKNIEPSDRGNTVEGTKGFCCNSQEEKDGECAGCCAGTTKALSPASTRKVAEAAKAQPETDTKQAEVGATKTQAETEAGPSMPTAIKPIAREEEMTG
jgi:hypothetical protein